MSVATDGPSVTEWNENYIVEKMSVGSDSRRSSQSMSSRMVQPSISSIHRLNDTLRASGFRPVPREAEVVDLVNSCIAAISSLQTRYSDLVAKHSQVSAPAVRLPVAADVQARAPIVKEADEETSALLSRMREEVVKLRKVSQSQHSKIASLEHLARARDAELEKMREFIKQKADEQNRRDALAMTTIREQRIGSSNVHLINNYLKQIDNLQRNNETLRKRNESLSVRLRIASKSDWALTEEDRPETLRCQIEVLQERLVDATSRAEAAQERLSRDQQEIFQLRNELSNLHQGLHTEREQTTILRETVAAQNERISHLLRYELICESISRMCQVDDLEALPHSVEKLVKVVNEIVPPMEAFVAECIARFGTKDLGLLKSRIVEMHDREPLIQGLTEIQARLHVPTHEVIPAIRRHIEAVDKNPIVKDVQGLLRVDNPALILPTLRSLQLRWEELTNFQSNLVSEIGLRRGVPLAECLRKIRSLTANTAPVVFGETNSEGDESPASEPSIDNLAFSNDFIRKNQRN